MEATISRIPQIGSSAIGQAAKLTDIGSSVMNPIRDVLADANFESLSNSFSTLPMHEMVKSFDIPAPKLPDYNLGEVFQNVTPNYTIPDHALRGLDSPTYPKDSWQQLIILGNGFDLQCGLRSKFGDFFKPRFEVIANIEGYTKAAWRGVLENSDLTLWDFILEANIDDAWCDIEGEIESWILSFSDQNSKTSLFWGALETTKRKDLFTDGMPYVVLCEGGKRLAGEEDDKIHLFCNMARYILTTNPKLPSEKCTPETFIDLLRQDLGKLEHAFGAYLSKEIDGNDEYVKKCRDLCQMIDGDGKQKDEDFYVSTSVLSFNYTNVAEDHFDKGDDGVFVNIHGKLGGDIIFGIDGKDCMDNPVAVPFTKTYRLMLRGGSRTGGLISTANSSTLQDATNVIKFYGHSLGKADYSYFQSIFDGVDLYESGTVLVFYFPWNNSDGAESINNEWRSRLANSINNLLVAYGATMDNPDHGKNLMHKLLLEGRLIIRGLPVNRYAR